MCLNLRMLLISILIALFIKDLRKINIPGLKGTLLLCIKKWLNDKNQTFLMNRCSAQWGEVNGRVT